MDRWLLWLLSFAIILILIVIAMSLRILYRRVATLFAVQDAVLSFLSHLFHLPTAIIITQLQGGSAMPITGILAGSTGTFAETPTPAGSVFPAGTTFVWTSSDPATSLTPSADGTAVAVAVAAGDTAPSFDLTCTSSFTPPGAGAPVAAKVTVPITQPTPPPPPTPTGIQIDQTA